VRHFRFAPKSGNGGCSNAFLCSLAAFDEIRKEFFKVPPPRTTVGTIGLLVKDALVEIDLIATR
jgi:enamine deaminase RidA (YjgF/YER057c/UK114 family)